MIAGAAREGVDYAFGERDGRPSITCLTCKKTSYHPVDVRERYCGYCHVFHDDRAAAVQHGLNWEDFRS